MRQYCKISSKTSPKVTWVIADNASSATSSEVLKTSRVSPHGQCQHLSGDPQGRCIGLWLRRWRRQIPPSLSSSDSATSGCRGFPTTHACLLACMFLLFLKVLLLEARLCCSPQILIVYIYFFSLWAEQILIVFIHDGYMYFQIWIFLFIYSLL